MVLTCKCCPVSFHLCPSSDRGPRRALCEHLNFTETLFYSHLPKHSVSHRSVWNKSTDNVILLLGITGFSSGSDLNNHLIVVATVPAATIISRIGHQNLALYHIHPVCCLEKGGVLASLILTTTLQRVLSSPFYSRGN